MSADKSTASQGQSSNNEFRKAFDALHAPLLRFLMTPEDPAPVAALALISAPLASTAPLLVAALLVQKGQNNQQQDHPMAPAAPMTQEAQKIEDQNPSTTPLAHAPVAALSEVAHGIQKSQDQDPTTTDLAPVAASVPAAQESRKNKRSNEIRSKDRSKKACFIAQPTADLPNDSSSPAPSLPSVFKVPAPPAQIPPTQSPLTTPPSLSNFAVLKAVISNFSSPYEIERRYNPRMGISKKEFEELEKMMKKKSDVITNAVRYNTRVDIVEYQNKIKALEKENEKLKAQLEEKKEGGE